MKIEVPTPLTGQWIREINFSSQFHGFNKDEVTAVLDAIAVSVDGFDEERVQLASAVSSLQNKLNNVEGLDGALDDVPNVSFNIDPDGRELNTKEIEQMRIRDLEAQVEDLSEQLRKASEGEAIDEWRKAVEERDKYLDKAQEIMELAKQENDELKIRVEQLEAELLVEKEKQKKADEVPASEQAASIIAHASRVHDEVIAEANAYADNARKKADEKISDLLERQKEIEMENASLVERGKEEANREVQLIIDQANDRAREIVEEAEGKASRIAHASAKVLDTQRSSIETLNFVREQIGSTVDLLNEGLSVKE